MEKKINPETKEKPSTLKTTFDYSACPTCGGSGWSYYEESPKEGYPEGVKLPYCVPCPTCKGGIDKRVEALKKSSDIPVAFYDKKYSAFNWYIYRDESGNAIDMSFEQKTIETFIKNYREFKKEGCGIYIYSATKGSGKTLLASCLCNEIVELYGIKTKFVVTPNLLDIAQSGDKESYDEYKRDPIKLLCNCELLVLDDIGQKKTGNEWLNDIIFRIVNERMNNNLITIFTSNYEIEHLFLEEATKERIKANTCVIQLPEYNVRNAESFNKKIQFFKRMGIIKDK